MDAILRYFSIYRLSPSNQGNPWSEFFDSSINFEDDHYRFMSDALSRQSRSQCKKAYALLMRTLDYHITAEPEQAEAAGVWLWDRLAVLRKHDKSEVLKYLRGLVDSRFMSIEVNKTPAALSTRAAITLRSLPDTMYMDEDVVHYLLSEALNLPPILQDLANSLNSVKFDPLKGQIRSIVTRFFCFKIESIKSSSGDRYASLIEGLEIYPKQKVRIFLKYLERDMRFILSAPRHENGPGVWKLLIPEHNFFPMIDFAMLFIPSNEDPPVLFPIKVICHICSQEPSDKNFAEGVIKRKKDLYLHPLLTTFAAETEGKGRVQFIWIGRNNEDLEKASSLEKFDNRSWFTIASDWTGLPENYEEPDAMPSLAGIGYSSGDAVAAACASLPAGYQSAQLCD